MFCPNCGTEFGDGANFCPKCGARRPQPQPVQESGPGQGAPPPPPTAPQAPPSPGAAPAAAGAVPAKKRSKRPLVIGILAVAAVTVAAVLAVFLGGGAGPEISAVQNGYLGEFTDMTVGEVFDGYFSGLFGYETGRWDSGVTDDGTTVVQLDYTGGALETTTIQFSMLDDACFKVTALASPFEVIEEPSDLLAALNKIYAASYEARYAPEEIAGVEEELLERLAAVNATSALYGAAGDYAGDRSQLYLLFGDTPLEMSAAELLDLYGVLDAGGEDGQDVSSGAVFSTGTFATESDASSVYENGGIVVELTVVDSQITYTVTSISAMGRIATISGAADQGSVIQASGDDGWFNIVAGEITAIDDDAIAVEFEVVTYDPDAMWNLGCPYTILTRCAEPEPPVPASSYPIEIRMDNLMSANILGDTFWGAYENGWLEEWMYLYVHGDSDPDILFEPFWYDAQLGEWTYYGITYDQAEEAGWGYVWIEIMANNGY